MPTQFTALAVAAFVSTLAPLAAHADKAAVDQSDDFKTGAGVRRPNSDYDRLSGRLRLGADLSDMIRIGGADRGLPAHGTACR